VNDGAITGKESFRTATSRLLWPAFSQDGTRLVYAETIALARSMIRIAAVAGGEDLSFPVTGVPSGFAWSPDGGRIAYHFETPSRENGVRLIVFDLETERFEDIARIHPGTWPVWSPDGSSLAYLPYGRDAVNFFAPVDSSVRPMPLDGFQGNAILFSPGSDSLVIYASRQVNGATERGLWVASIQEPRLVNLMVGRIDKLLHWRDGHIYFQAADQFLRIAIDGGAPEVFATLDEDCPSDPALNTLAPDLITVVCASSIDRTDLMIVQGFDAN
jgi:hypothetical protein